MMKSGEKQIQKKKSGLSKLVSMVLMLALIITSVNLGCPVSFRTAAAQSGNTPDNANLDFENGTGQWTTSGDVSVVSSGGKDGGKYLHLAAGASVSETIEVKQGSYTLSAWVRGKQNGKNDAKLILSDTGAPNAESLLNVYLSGSWVQMANRNVLVYNGQMKVTITAGSCEVDVDLIELACDSEDVNPLSNWNFEGGGTTGWNTSGTVTADAGNADTGDYAVRLADQSEISQTISVKPNTKYSVTMRAKVDRQDEFETIYHTNYRGKTGETQNRKVLGDRINLGVRRTNGTVLRQAPAGTTGYALVSVTFTTGASDTSVEVYANTKYDQNYKDSVTVYSTTESKEEDGGKVDTVKSLADNWTSNGNDFAYADNFDVFEIDDANYLRGADISFLPAIENFGGKYFANGVQQDCLRILSNHGVNSVLTMIMVHAGKVTHSTTTGKALDQLEGQGWDLRKEDGTLYEYKMIEGGYFDKEHCLQIGKRATELGMSYIPSFHFSDTWISNAKAYTPEEWLNVDYAGNYTNSDIEHIQSAVYNYVYDFMKTLADEQVNIGAVKIGNEQNAGMIWPVGQGSTSAGHAKVITAAYDAIQDVVPGTSGWVHSNNGYTPGSIDGFFGKLLKNGAKMGGVTFSLYGGRSSYNTILNAKQIASLDALKYMDFVNVETGFTFTRYSPTVDTAVSSMYMSAYYQGTPNGQYNWLMDFMQAALDVENPHGQTRGFYYWETDWIPTPGAGSSAGASSDINVRTMFNNGDVNIHEMGSSQDGRAGDMLESMYAYLMRGVAKKTTTDMRTPLTEGNSHTYAVDIAEPTGISLAETDIALKVGENKKLKPTIAPEGKVLTDWSIEYTSSDPGVAYINGNGFVCAKSVGTAVITAKVGDQTATAQVTVTDQTAASGISVTVNGSAAKDMSAKIFDRIQMTASLSGNPTDTTVVYRSSNPEVASFFGETWQTPKGEMRQETEKGTKVQLNAIGVGTTTITVATIDGKQSMSFKVTVTKTDVTDIAIEGEKEISISYGRTKQLSAKVTPNDASRYKVIWESSNPDIVSVDETGLISATGVGDATITVYSDDDPAIKDTCTVHALNVQTEGVSLDKETLVLQLGSTKPVTALVTPSDAYDKSVRWESEDTGIATVNANGEVTGTGLGTTKVTAITNNGGYKAECKIIVQADSVPVTGVKMDEDTYYFQTDHFSEVNPAGDMPVHRLTATVEPETATNSDVTWESDTPEVATVDEYGRVTAVAPGVAVIKAVTKDGGFECSAKVFVPSVSESFDNRESEAWGTVANPETGGQQGASLNIMDDGNKVMKLSGGGSGGRGFLKKFKTITANKKIVVAFDWMPEALSYSTGSYIAIGDSSNHRYFTIQQNTVNGELVYAAGGENLKVLDGSTTIGNIGTGFNDPTAWYHIHAVVDSENRKTTLTVTNQKNPAVTATHVLDFTAGTAYEGNVGSLLGLSGRSSGTMNVSMAFDNFNIYPAAPVVQKVVSDTDAIKLIPVKGTKMASYQLKVTVLPASMAQEVIYTSSDTSVAVVSSTGLVTPAATYDNLEDVPEKTCTITAASKEDPDKKVVIPVTITKSLNASEFFSVQDEDGSEVWPQNSLEMKTASVKKLRAVLTGGDGDTDIAKISWASGDPLIAEIDGNGTVIAKKTGETVITLKVTLYTGEEKIAEIPLSVTGISYADTFGIDGVIDSAKAAKENPDDYYDADSLLVYKEALEKAESISQKAKDEQWLSERQPEIDALENALQTAVDGLKKAEFIPLQTITLTAPGHPVSIGKQAEVTVTSEPAYATEKVVFSSDNTDVAIVDRVTGKIYAKAKGSAVITASSESGTVQKTVTIQVTDDLTSYYTENGITSSGTTASRPLTNAFNNARTTNMRVGNDAWTPGGGVKSGEIIIDFGMPVRIENVATSFWTKLLYKMDVSDNGETWETVVDHSSEAVGAIDKTDSAPYVDEFPENTKARYLRISDIHKEDNGDWLGITILQVNGAYLPDQLFVTDLPELEGVISAYDTAAAARIKLPQSVEAVLSDGTTENAPVEWSETDLYAALEESGESYLVHGAVVVDGIRYDVTCNVQLDHTHVHKWTYTAGTGSDTGKIFAVCTRDGCMVPEESLVITLQTEDAKYSGEPHGAVIVNKDDFTAATGATIETVYYLTDGVTKTSPDNSGALQEGEMPVKEGEYQVKLVVLENEAAAIDINSSFAIVSAQAEEPSTTADMTAEPSQAPAVTVEPEQTVIPAEPAATPEQPAASAGTNAPDTPVAPAGTNASDTPAASAGTNVPLVVPAGTNAPAVTPERTNAPAVTPERTNGPAATPAGTNTPAAASTGTNAPAAAPVEISNLDTSDLPAPMATPEASEESEELPVVDEFLSDDGTLEMAEADREGVYRITDSEGNTVIAANAIVMTMQTDEVTGENEEVLVITDDLGHAAKNIVVETDKGHTYAVGESGIVETNAIVEVTTTDSTGKEVTKEYLTKEDGTVAKAEVVEVIEKDSSADSKNYLAAADGTVVRTTGFVEVSTTKTVLQTEIKETTEIVFVNEDGSLKRSERFAVTNENGEKEYYAADAHSEIIKDGFFNTGNSDTTEKAVKAGKTYYAGKDGVIVTNKVITQKTTVTSKMGNVQTVTKKYVAGKNGVIAKKKITKLDGKKYYSGAAGVVAVKKLVKCNGNKYYATKSGMLATKKWVTVGKKKYYCAKSGKITKVKKVKQ